MQPIISVEGLGKQYRIGQREVPYKTLRESLAGALDFPRRVARRLARRSSVDNAADDKQFWALKDVSFEVHPGEIVGIIGRNGSGKSTLLKVLSRVTEPTEGSVKLWGRIGSLLEVGTGFHPELTGRENVYLNGSILGMSRAEIKRKFDEIIAFAEIEQFLDTPVKRYSSGMYVRLAFAVAVHLEPEVLVIDEVLAVGDADFQKKCLDQMRRLSRGERTILFVSHNMSAIRNICDRALAMQRGILVDQGKVEEVVDRYLDNSRGTSLKSETITTAGFCVNHVEAYSLRGSLIKPFDPVRIEVKFTARVDVADPGMYIGILTNEGDRLAGLDLKDFQSAPPVASGQTISLGFHIDSLPLLPGIYQLELHLKDMARHRIEFVPGYFPFEVVESPVYGSRKLDTWFGRIGLKASSYVNFSSTEEN